MTRFDLIVIAMLAIFVLNVPFGYWRAGLRKLSAAWFVAIHAPIPLAIGLRFAMGLPFELRTLPLFILAFFAGQTFGARLGRRRGRVAPLRQPAGDR